MIQFHAFAIAFHSTTILNSKIIRIKKERKKKLNKCLNSKAMYFEAGKTKTRIREIQNIDCTLLG